MRISPWILATVFPLWFGLFPAEGHSPGLAGGEAHTLEQGRSSVSIDYEFIRLRALSDAAMAAAVTPSTHVHSLKTIASVAASFAYGVTDNLTVILRMPWVRRTGIREAHVHDPLDPVSFHQLGTSSGVGDLTGIAQYRFMHDHVRGIDAAVLIGVKAPTGKTNARTNDGDLFDAEFQPGSGSWDVIFGAAFSKEFGGPFSVHSSVMYVVAGTGTQDTDLGDRFAYNLSLVYRITGPDAHVGALAHSEPHRHSHPIVYKAKASAPAPALDVMLELNGDWHAKSRTQGVADPNSGGHTLYLSPGLRLTVDRWSGYVSVGVPIVNELNGTQAKPRWRALTGASVNF
jgi:hypothetical protein